MNPSSPEGDRDMRSGGVPEAQSCDLDQASAAIGQISTHKDPGPGERMSRLLSTLRSQVIPQLARAHGLSGAPTRSVGANEVEAFTQMILHEGESRVQSHVEALKRDGVPLESVFLDLFAPAARRLGEMWTLDSAGFADVTVAVGRLQRLLRSLSPAFGSEVERPLHSLRVLLAAPPGEQHTFGLSMVGEFFRRGGWDVTGGLGSTHLDAVTECRTHWFDAVGFSVGTQTRLDWLTLSIADVRRVSRNREVMVMVGGPLFNAHPEVLGQVGADLSSVDGREAPRAAQQWLVHRPVGA